MVGVYGDGNVITRYKNMPKKLMGRTGLWLTVVSMNLPHHFLGSLAAVRCKVSFFFIIEYVTRALGNLNRAVSSQSHLIYYYI